MMNEMETGKSAGGDGMSWVVHEDMKIEMTKGDTPSFAFQAFLPDGSEYEFEEGDSVVFAAKRNKADPEPAVRIEADVKEKVISLSLIHILQLMRRLFQESCYRWQMVLFILMTAMRFRSTIKS